MQCRMGQPSTLYARACHLCIIARGYKQRRSYVAFTAARFHRSVIHLATVVVCRFNTFRLQLFWQMFRGKRARGKGPRKVVHHPHETARWTSASEEWRPDLHTPQLWQPQLRARLPLQQIQQGSYYPQQQPQHPHRNQQVNTSNVFTQVDSGAQTSYVSYHTGCALNSTIATTQLSAQTQSTCPATKQLHNATDSPRNGSDEITNVAFDLQRKTLPFGWMIGRVFKCSCGASLCPSFGVHRCNCDNPQREVGSLNSLSISNGTHQPMKESMISQESGTTAATKVHRSRKSHAKILQQMQRDRQEAGKDVLRGGTPKDNNTPRCPEQAQPVKATQNVAWPFFGHRTEQVNIGCV